MIPFSRTLVRALLWVLPLNAALVTIQLLLPSGPLESLTLNFVTIVNFPSALWLFNSGEWLLKHPNVNWFLISPALSVPSSILWAILAAGILTIVKKRNTEQNKD